MLVLPILSVLEVLLPFQMPFICPLVAQSAVPSLAAVILSQLKVLSAVLRVRSFLATLLPSNVSFVLLCHDVAFCRIQVAQCAEVRTILQHKVILVEVDRIRWRHSGHHWLCCGCHWLCCWRPWLSATHRWRQWRSTADRRSQYLSGLSPRFLSLVERFQRVPLRNVDVFTHALDVPLAVIVVGVLGREVLRLLPRLLVPIQELLPKLASF